MGNRLIHYSGVKAAKDPEQAIVKFVITSVLVYGRILENTQGLRP